LRNEHIQNITLVGGFASSKVLDVHGESMIRRSLLRLQHVR